MTNAQADAILTQETTRTKSADTVAIVCKRCNRIFTAPADDIQALTPALEHCAAHAAEDAAEAETRDKPTPRPRTAKPPATT